MKPKVYIAGPYTKGDVERNVANAIDAADWVTEAGGVPFVPHLTHLWHLRINHPWAYWLKYDREWLSVCDIFYRISGYSMGADIEKNEAEESGMIICRTKESLIKAIKAWEG